jgi:N-acetylglucosamine kinase-like BadF-type ATPase
MRVPPTLSKGGTTLRYFMGVDAGATKTFALVGDETGRLIALGKGGPGNHQTPGGVERAMGCIAEAVDAALAAAGLAPAELAHASFCLAGADFPSDYELLNGAIASRWPGLRFTVHNDGIAGLRAGTSQGWGVVSICGTGTNQLGIGKDGRELQVAGMGGLWGDFGGGADLGREAIKVAFMGDDQRGPDTLLTTIVLEHFGYPSMYAFGQDLYAGKIDRSLIPKLAPHVFTAANMGDVVAQEILIGMGTALGISVGAVIRQLHLTGDVVEVVMAGSTWKGANPLMVDSFRLSVHRTAPWAKLVRPRYEPVVGAWLVAAERSGIQVDKGIYATLEATLPGEIPVIREETGC